jgi:hypothetical protein
MPLAERCTIGGVDREGIQVKRIVAIGWVLLALGGCSQWQTYKCVRDTVNRNEPYHTQADRDDSESLAWQACRESAAARGR